MRKVLAAVVPLCLAIDALGVVGCGGESSTPAADSSTLDAVTADAIDANAEAAVDGGCDGGCDGASDAPTVRCAPEAGTCPALAIDGDPPVAGPWQGYADPSLFHDPTTASRFWLAYSFLVQRTLPSSAGDVTVLSVETHLAQSDDGGASFAAPAAGAVLFAAPEVDDPGGSGQKGIWSSEVPSVTAATIGGKTVWFGSRMRYFLPPIGGYHPDFLTTYTLRVAMAEGDSPAVLSTAPDVGLALSTTNAAYGVDVRLPALDPAVTGCVMLNNPAILFEDGTLYLTTECLAYSAPQVRDDARSKVVIFSATPKGAPSTWSWRYVGTLSNQTTAKALGATYLAEPEIDVASDGSLVALLSPFDPKTGVGSGCLAVALASIDPPMFVEDCTGAPLVVATQTAPSSASFNTSACTYDRGSATGMITVALRDPKGLFSPLLWRTSLRP